jgi:tartrate/fumarate subfamily iron-sulfur-dependent hydro-lyase beta chain
MIRELQYPFTLEKIRELRVGDRVAVSGRVFTGRDRAHKYLADGGKCPVDLRDGALYHCGPVVMRKEDGWVVRAAGPTTSVRQEPYMARIIGEHHVRVIIGKGGMGEATRKACAQCGCVYLHAVGGAAAVLAGGIERVAGVHFLSEFGPTEAMWEFEVKGLEAVVTTDARGRSLHNRIRAASKRALRRLSA